MVVVFSYITITKLSACRVLSMVVINKLLTL